MITRLDYFSVLDAYSTKQPAKHSPIRLLSSLLEKPEIIFCPVKKLNNFVNLEIRKMLTLKNSKQLFWGGFCMSSTSVPFLLEIA